MSINNEAWLLQCLSEIPSKRVKCIITLFLCCNIHFVYYILKQLRVYTYLLFSERALSLCWPSIKRKQKNNIDVCVFKEVYTHVVLSPEVVILVYEIIPGQSTQQDFWLQFAPLCPEGSCQFNVDVRMMITRH